MSGGTGDGSRGVRGERCAGSWPRTQAGQPSCRGRAAPVGPGGLWSLIGAWAAALSGCDFQCRNRDWRHSSPLAWRGSACCFCCGPGMPSSAETPRRSLPAPRLLWPRPAWCWRKWRSPGQPPCPSRFARAAEGSTVVRIRVELNGTPRARLVADKFSPEAREHTRYQVEARAGSMRSGIAGSPSIQLVTLGYAESLAPVGAHPRAAPGLKFSPGSRQYRPGNAADSGSRQSPRCGTGNRQPSGPSRTNAPEIPAARPGAPGTRARAAAGDGVW